MSLAAAPRGLSLRNYIIRYGQGFGLAQTIREVNIISFGIMILTKTKNNSNSYFHNWLVYDVVCFPSVTTATKNMMGGVGLVVREQPQGWRVDSTCFRRENVVICEVAFGSRRTPLVGSYPPPPPFTLEHLPNIEEALDRFWDQDIISLGDLNAEIGQA